MPRSICWISPERRSPTREGERTKIRDEFSGRVGDLLSGEIQQIERGKIVVMLNKFREAEAILVQDEFPIMPIYFYVVSGLVRPYVKEFYSALKLPDGSSASNLQDLHPFHDVWIDAEARARETFR